MPHFAAGATGVKPGFFAYDAAQQEFEIVEARLRCSMRATKEAEGLRRRVTAAAGASRE